MLTGSTRLKAGTAQKLALNRITTAAMVVAGRVADNHMIDLTGSNAKLRARAIRIVMDLGGLGEPEARHAAGGGGLVGPDRSRGLPSARAAVRTGGGRVTENGDQDRDLLSLFPLVDGHNDVAWEIRERFGGDPSRADLNSSVPELHTDLPRLRRGGVGAQFWSVYVPGTLQGDAAVAATLEQVDLVHRMIRRYGDTLELALTADDITRIFASGKIASLLGAEGGQSIAGSMGVLRMLHRLGVGT